MHCLYDIRSLGGLRAINRVVYIGLYRGQSGLSGASTGCRQPGGLLRWVGWAHGHVGTRVPQSRDCSSGKDKEIQSDCASSDVTDSSKVV